MFQGRIGGTAAKRVLALFMAALFAATLSLAGCASPDSTATDDNADAPAAAVANDAAAGDSATVDSADGQGIGVNICVLDPADSTATAQKAAVTVAEGATVLDALEASGIDAVVEDSAYGKYLTSIAGTAAEGSSGWVYTVNGNEVMESIDTCVLSDGDTVTFEYITM